MDAFVTAYTQSDILGKLIILGLISFVHHLLDCSYPKSVDDAAN